MSKAQILKEMWLKHLLSGLGLSLIERLIEELEVIVADEVDSGNKVKLGKLLELESQTKASRRHYDGIDKIHGG